MRICRRLWQWHCNDHGATAVEYAVMLAMILLVVIAGVANFGLSQNAMWGRVDTQMKAHGID